MVYTDKEHRGDLKEEKNLDFQKKITNLKIWFVNRNIQQHFVSILELHTNLAIFPDLIHGLNI